jgi:eukaryotic-like serine/threonine-protein kinase
LIFETITGRMAFSGQTQASLVGSILKDEPPPLSAVQKSSPPALDFAVRKCLSKDPDDHWQSVRDVMSQLEWIATGPASPQIADEPAGRRSKVTRRETLAWAAVGILAALLAVVARPSTVEQIGNSRDVRFEISVPEADPLSLSISPDGTVLAFVAKARDSEQRLLWARPLSETVAHPIAGTEGAWAPFWSPDGGSVAFATESGFKKVDVRGGSPRTLWEVSPNAAGLTGTWNSDNTIVLSSGAALMRISALGGAPTLLMTPDPSRGESALLFPSFLPDGRHFIYSVRSTDPAKQGIYVGSLDSPQKTRLIDALSTAAYAKPGYLVFKNLAR